MLSSPKMKSLHLDIKTTDGTCDTFIAYPDDEGSYPAVLFFMDAFGPRARLYEMAEKLASHGYFVLLPNLFYRMRRAPIVNAQFPLTAEQRSAAVEQFMPLLRKYDPEAGVRDAKDLLEFLSRQKQVRPGKVAITGYCMGGSLAIRTAARLGDAISAAACFHGGNLAADSPQSVHHLVKDIRAQLYFAHADHDESLPPEQIARLQSALDQAKIRYEAELYPEAPHGFTMADLPAYRKEAADRHWVKLLGLLQLN